ncbi:hypothetical protein ACWD6L_19185 [Micromonospora profundi]|uniref:hypothetical protein n=1 Tax=Micromonospora TaxID=1873 RepID=UPI0006AE6C1C|nr:MULTISPECIES: hypothetical protein [Micromonospora]KOX11775.1 hypothetical protein ADK66_06290 [Micromonospora sp. NRRL B-16802]NJC12754.1 hypothetical protein [Micromonospora profundi]
MSDDPAVEEWGDGRLVVRRAEVPDSDIAGMTVVTTRAEHIALNAIVYALVDKIREEDAAQLSRNAIPYPLLADQRRKDVDK